MNIFIKILFFPKKKENKMDGFLFLFFSSLYLTSLRRNLKKNHMKSDLNFSQDFFFLKPFKAIRFNQCLDKKIYIQIRAFFLLHKKSEQIHLKFTSETRKTLTKKNTNKQKEKLENLMKSEVFAEIPSEVGNAVDGEVGRVIKVVKDDGSEATKKKLEDGVATNVASATGDEDGGGGGHGNEMEWNWNWNGMLVIN